MCIRDRISREEHLKFPVIPEAYNFETEKVFVMLTLDSRLKQPTFSTQCLPGNDEESNAILIKC